MPDIQRNINFAEEIQKLKKSKNAVVLAHYYQRPEIQDCADYVGDSLALSKEAAATQADIIVFAGVHFMAETAKILNPGKKVLLPDLQAGCSLSESCPPKMFSDFRKKHPDHLAVTYINCSAEIKAHSDIICTSSNAKKIIESIPKNQPILFAPDRNLGKYLIKETGRDLLLWEGACIVHEAFSFQKILDLHQKYPLAKIVAHPESETAVLEVAHFIGSTAAMIQYIKTSPVNEFLIATEPGIIHELSKTLKNKKLIPVPSKEDNTCACSECAFMKLNTLEKLYECLLHETPEINLQNDLIQRALVPLNRMLELSN